MPSPTPFGWFSDIDSLFPEECKDEQLGSFADGNQGFISGACKLPTLSQDASMLAYVLAKKIEISGSTPSLSEVVKILVLGQPSPVEIYHLAHYSIGAITWSSDGRLVITDIPIEGSSGDTVIYDPNRRMVVQTLHSPTWDYGWNLQRTVFYTIQALGPEDYGSVCANALMGYDFVHNVALPSLKSVNQDGDFIKVIGDPLWSADGTRLTVVLRSGRGLPVRYDSVFGPSYIVEIDLSKPIPKLSIIDEDKALDYSIELLSNGEYQIDSSPYAPITCMGLW